MKKINEIMTSSPESCNKTSTIQEAAQTMKENNVGSLPVVDQNEKVVGIITDRDIALAVGKNNKSVNDLKVSDVMTSDVHTVKLEDNTNTALETMRTKKVGRLPVVDSEKRLKGIVTITNIAKNIQGSSDKGQVSEGKENLMKTLLAIAERNETKEPVLG